MSGCPWLAPSKSVPFRFCLHLAAGHVKYNIAKHFGTIARELKSALLSSQRGELERMLVAAEEEWLRLAGDLDAARGKDSPRGPAVKI